VQLAVFGDVHRFARCQVADQGEAEHVQRTLSEAIMYSTPSSV
jgi:hypothetical protein